MPEHDVTLAGNDPSGGYYSVDVINHEGKTSIYTAAGFTDTESVHLDVATNSTLIAYMLIDISDTTNWKHTNTDHIVIEYIMLEVDPDSSFAGEIKIGYLKNVDGTNGDFVQLIDIDMRRKADLFPMQVDFGTHGLHCDDAHHFGPTIANSTLFQTDVDLGGPDDPGTLTYPSGDSDIVMIVDGDGTNFVNVSITLGYESIA